MSDLQRGDVLFYVGTMDSPLDVAIMLRTKSKIVHTAVMVDEYNTVQAQSRGIVRCEPGNWSYVLKTSKLTTDVVRLGEATTWVLSKVGEPYGFADLVNQGLMLIGKETLLLDMSYDCSHLVACFLWIAGVRLAPVMIDANTVTPADLYNYFVGNALAEVEERTT